MLYFISPSIFFMKENPIHLTFPSYTLRSLNCCCYFLLHLPLQTLQPRWLLQQDPKQLFRPSNASQCISTCLPMQLAQLRHSTPQAQKHRIEHLWEISKSFFVWLEKKIFLFFFEKKNTFEKAPTSSIWSKTIIDDIMLRKQKSDVFWLNDRLRNISRVELAIVASEERAKSRLTTFFWTADSTQATNTFIAGVGWDERKVKKNTKEKKIKNQPVRRTSKAYAPVRRREHLLLAHHWLGFSATNVCNTKNRSNILIFWESHKSKLQDSFKPECLECWACDGQIGSQSPAVLEKTFKQKNFFSLSVYLFFCFFFLFCFVWEPASWRARAWYPPSLREPSSHRARSKSGNEASICCVNS